MKDLNNEQELLRRLKKSKKKAFKELYNIYWESLFISAYNILKNKEVCEEIIQNVFISIWKNRTQLQIKTSLKSYLYTSVRYQVFYQIKKNKERKHVTFFDNLEKRLEYNSPEVKMIYKDLIKQINSIVNNLPEKCQKVYRLSREEQLSHKEISKRLNISIKTVQNHITKALQILRTHLQNVSLLFTFFHF